MDTLVKILGFIALLGGLVFLFRHILSAAANRRRTGERDQTDSPADSLSAATSFPAWTFNIPTDVANQGFWIAIYGQDPTSGKWLYWNGSSYVQFSAGEKGMDTAPLIKATPNSHNNFTVSLPSSQYLKSCVVAMFIGSSSGIPVNSGVPGSPTSGTNPGDVFSIFELTYEPDKGGSPTLDIDISNVDQVGFTYTVKSSDNAPFPLGEVGSPIPQQTVFSQFAKAFPAGHAFHDCLLYGRAGGKQVRLLAPQDVLAAISAPVPPSYLAPTGAPTSPDPFAEDHSYFYLASESSLTGETVPSPGAFGGFLLDASGQPQAAGIDVGWQNGGTPAAYAPTNPTATAVNIYRADVPPVRVGQPVPLVPTTGYQLLISKSIADWNNQNPPYYFDRNRSTPSQQGPRTSSYGFSALSTWFDHPLREFFAHYQQSTFQLYQSNQSGSGQNGTMWTGRVQLVSPKQGQQITALKYIDHNGNEQSISAAWQWGDGSQQYLVLQLVGNAYNPDDFSTKPAAGQPGLTQGEYEGAVLNIYFPYFTGNTGMVAIEHPSYTLPGAPAWLDNAVYGPSQMVFGCSGVFATINDPDAVAQEEIVDKKPTQYAGLAANALTNLENVIVSALNRGVATGYGFKVQPQQYSCLYAFSKAATLHRSLGPEVPPGTYTYYLSGVLNNGDETVLSWPQTVIIGERSSAVVTLEWLPQPASLYKQVNVYRQKDSGPIQLVGMVKNTSTSLATSFEDRNNLPAQPTDGAPFTFYPSWSNPSGSNYVASNLFSAFLHQNWNADPTSGISINGLCYGYPFDDQGSFSTNINYGKVFPTSVTFAINKLS